MHAEILFSSFLELINILGGLELVFKPTYMHLRHALFTNQPLIGTKTNDINVICDIEMTNDAGIASTEKGDLGLSIRVKFVYV